MAPRETIPPRYHLRLMFEWRGGCLWAGNEAALRAFDVGSIEDKLPLSAETLARLEELSEWHDTALDWDDPGGPSLWTAEEEARFERAAAEVLAQVRAELGPEYSVGYREM